MPASTSAAGGGGSAGRGDGIDRIVLVHGGMHGSWCWERVVPRLAGDVVAVDLPGRPEGSGPVTLDGWVDTVISATAPAGRSLIVGHSLGGISVLAAAGRAPERVGGIVLIAAVVPRPGQCYWDLLPGPLALLRRVLGIGEDELVLPSAIARYMLCSGLSRADRERILSRLVPESGAVLGTPVDYRLADGLDVTYVHTRRDRMIRPSSQRRYAGLLPAGTRRLRLDSGHCALYARADELAGIINGLAGRGPGEGRAPRSTNPG